MYSLQVWLIPLIFFSCKPFIIKFFFLSEIFLIPPMANYFQLEPRTFKLL